MLGLSSKMLARLTEVEKDKLREAERRSRTYGFKGWQYRGKTAKHLRGIIYHIDQLKPLQALIEAEYDLDVIRPALAIIKREAEDIIKEIRAFRDKGAKCQKNPHTA